MPKQPEQDILGDLRAKKEMMNEARKALGNEPPAELPKAPPVQMNVDKINRNGKFGDRPGEKRIPVDQMVKPLGSFKNGTDYVPKTGVYKLHEGEAVKTAKENSMDPMALVPGRSEEKPKKEVHEIRTRKAKSGGFIHEHHHTRPEHHKMEEHASADMKGALSHINDHMGDGSSMADVMGSPTTGT